MIALKIDLTKIPKDRIFNGKKGKYIDVIVFENREEDEYGYTHNVQVSLSREEREQGVKPIYLGNGKLIGQTNKVPPKGKAPAADIEDYDDDLPF